MSTVRPVLFVNFSNQPFSATPYTWPLGSEEQMVDEHCKWDNIPDSFAPHASRYMEEWRAEHFAKHLINRELDKIGKPINDEKLRSEMLKKCIMDKAPEVNSANIDMELMNKNMEPKVVKEVTTELPEVKRFCEFCDSKGGRHKLECPTLKPIEVKSIEFPDLNK